MNESLLSINLSPEQQKLEEQEESEIIERMEKFGLPICKFLEKLLIEAKRIDEGINLQDFSRSCNKHYSHALQKKEKYTLFK